MERERECEHEREWQQVASWLVLSQVRVFQASSLGPRLPRSPFSRLLFASEKRKEGLGNDRTNTRIALVHVHPHQRDCPTNTPNRRPRTYRPRSMLGLSDDLSYACFLLLPRLLLLASSSSREDIPVRKRLHHGVSSSISSTPTSDSVSPTALPSHTAT